MGSVDFWITKNISGRFLVGLRWWNEVKKDGKEVWIFESKNEKPKNLNFNIEGKDKKYLNLEELSKELKGTIQNDKKFTIQWEWEYEKNESDNKQDTQDGINLKKYNFTICAMGE